MVFASSIESKPLTGADGAPLGVVSNVLYHPSEPRAIGVAVRPTALLMVVDRPGTYLPLSAVTFGDEGTTCGLAKLPSTRRGSDQLGFDPDITVIWTGMTVLGPGGTIAGRVSDVGFDEATGQVARLDIGGGTVADVAHGRFIVSGESVAGYRDGAVWITVEGPELDGSGGFAKKAAEGAVAAGVVARAAGDAVIEASGAAGSAIKAAVDSDIAQRATQTVKRTWRDSVKAFQEGMKDEK